MIGLDFGKAIEELKNGHSVARKGWGCENMRLFLVKGQIPSDTHNAETYIEGMPISIFDQDELTPNNHIPHIALVNRGGSFIHGWNPSQIDMLAEDWFTIKRD